jgi:hypothetical protein
VSLYPLPGDVLSLPKGEEYIGKVYLTCTGRKDLTDSTGCFIIKKEK